MENGWACAFCGVPAQGCDVRDHQTTLSRPEECVNLWILGLKKLLKNAPHTADQIATDNRNRPYSREQAAFPAKSLLEYKFWPHVGRVDNVFGDRNPVCSCARLCEKIRWCRPSTVCGFYFPARETRPIADIETSHLLGHQIASTGWRQSGQIRWEASETFLWLVAALRVQPRCVPGESPKSRSQPSAPPAAGLTLPARRKSVCVVCAGRPCAFFMRPSLGPPQAAVVTVLQNRPAEFLARPRQCLSEIDFQFHFCFGNCFAISLTNAASASRFWLLRKSA